jgi:hypothetical protein
MKEYIITKNKRNKRNIFLIILFFICFILVNFTIIYYQNHVYKINKSINDSIDGRTFLVSPKSNIIQNMTEEEFYNYKYDYDKINSIEHVVASFPAHVQSGYDSSLKDDYYDGTLYLKYGSKEILKMDVIGHKMKDDDRNVMICPIKFYPSNYSFENAGNLKFIDGKSLIGKKIDVMYDLYEKNEKGKNVIVGQKKIPFEIIGVYDNELNYEEYNTCFVGGKQLYEMYDDYLGKLNSYQLYSIDVITDSAKNTSYVKGELNKLGYSTLNKVVIDYGELLHIEMICIGIIIITSILTLGISALYIKKYVIYSSYDIALLYALGYSKKKIEKIYFYNVLYVIGIGFVISNFISIIVSLFINTKSIIYCLLGTTIIGIAIILLNYLFIKKLLKRKSIYFMKESN